MPCSFHRVLAGLVISALIIPLSAIAWAEQPEMEMHRRGATADDGSGWHVAVSTKGSFSIRTPIPFNDFTQHDPKGKEPDVHGIGAVTPEGAEFAVVELAVTEKTPQVLMSISPGFRSDRPKETSDVRHETANGVDSVSYSVTDRTNAAHLKIIRTNGRIYILAIEFPERDREAVAKMKDGFFGSFALKPKN
jgi:hypothetical protein